MIHRVNLPSSSYCHFLFVLHSSIWRLQLRSVPHVRSRCLAWSRRCGEEGDEHPSSAGKLNCGVGKELC